MDWADQLDMMDDDCDIEGFPMGKLIAGERTKEDLVAYFGKRVASAIEFAVQSVLDVYSYMCKIVACEISDEQLRFHAKDCVLKIDWDNPSLMHKGLHWIVQNYFTQMGVPWTHGQV